MDNNEMNTDANVNDQTVQQPVQQPVQQTNNYYNTNLEEPISIGSWLVTMLIMLIPCVNIVMVFVWAFGSESKTKGNFFKAYLIMAAIVIVINIVILVVFGAALAGMAGSMGAYNWNMY
jgi:ABC-type multidrug transport system permease subunit